MQSHYVGLDKVTSTTPVPDLPPNVQSSDPPQSEPPKGSGCYDSDNVCDDNQSTNDLPIDDATFVEGDEHSRQITGGPSATMMSIKDPEAFAEKICLAPGEGQKTVRLFLKRWMSCLHNCRKSMGQSTQLLN